MEKKKYVFLSLKKHVFCFAQKQFFLMDVSIVAITIASTIGTYLVFPFWFADSEGAREGSDLQTRSPPERKTQRTRLSILPFNISIAHFSFKRWYERFGDTQW